MSSLFLIFGQTKQISTLAKLRFSVVYHVKIC